MPLGFSMTDITHSSAGTAVVRVAVTRPAMSGAAILNLSARSPTLPESLVVKKTNATTTTRTAMFTGQYVTTINFGAADFKCFSVQLQQNF